MTKAELAKAVFKAEAAPTQQKAGEILDVIFNVLEEAVIAGETITLPNFGVFKTVERSPRKGRNPRTGEEIDIPAQKAIKFVPAKILKEAVANG